MSLFQLKHCRFILFSFAIFLSGSAFAFAQPSPAPLNPKDQGAISGGSDVDSVDAAASTPETVEVQPLADDTEIAQRLAEILNATKWFRQPQVRVDKGVVFLSGSTKSDTFKKWAGDLSRNTRDVVAVVNRIDVDAPSVWDSSNITSQLTDIGRSIVRAIPIIVFAIVVLTLAWWVTKILSALVQRSLVHRLNSNLLRKTAARAVGLFAFLLAVYVVLQVAGLTRLALTIAGGTGVLGLALGIAFKDITENFLASIYLSVQKPFEIADLVEIDGTLGYVQRVTARTTILMTLDGNHVQIPNAIVFKNSLRNFTSNPNRRIDFSVGIGYDDPIIEAQAVTMKVLREHPAVLDSPEPWVLVESLGASTVNLRVYFWINGKEHSWLKVQSAIIRLTKGTLQSAGISLPDEAREILFPQGVPVHLIREDGESSAKSLHSTAIPVKAVTNPEPETSAAEDDLSSDADELEAQARHSRLPEQGENLLSE